VLVLENHF